jgi:hypothetical protein
VSSNNERRTETRLDRNATVFIETMAADGLHPPEVIICNSLDISANGVQVQMDKPVPVGSILRLCAEFAADVEPMYLVGEVKWVSQQQEQYFIGFALFEADDTHIMEWKQLIADNL